MPTEAAQPPPDDPPASPPPEPAAPPRRLSTGPYLAPIVWSDIPETPARDENRRFLEEWRKRFNDGGGFG